MITEFCKALNVNEVDILDGGKYQLAEYRQMYWLLLSRNGFTNTQIAKLNNRCQGSVSVGITKIGAKIDRYPDLLQKWNQIKTIKR